MMIDALDDDVVNTLGDDAFKAARQSAKARFDEFSKTFAGRIADEGIPPERLTQRLFGATSLKDIRSLKQSLTSGTPEQIARGQTAMKIGRTSWWERVGKYEQITVVGVTSKKKEKKKN